MTVYMLMMFHYPLCYITREQHQHLRYSYLHLYQALLQINTDFVNINIDPYTNNRKCSPFNKKIRQFYLESIVTNKSEVIPAPLAINPVTNSLKKYGINILIFYSIN